MIKVLFVLNHFRYSNGVASALLNLIKNLPEEKYDIHVLAIYEFDREFAQPVIDRITVVPGLNRYFKGLDRIVSAFPARMLYRYFIKEKYDLEIAFQYGIATIMLSVSDNPNRICWMHGYDEKMALRKYYKTYKRIVTVSEAGRNKLEKDGFPPAQIDYCYNIIDEIRIQNLSSESVELSTDKLLIVSVGRLSPEKGYLRFLESIHKLGDLKNNAEFWIIGDGPEKERLELFIQDHRLSGCVKLLGSRKNPYKYLRMADLYFCSSLHEGFSTTCQEAAILGVPVVSTNVDGAEELNTLAQCGEVIMNSSESIEQELIKLVRSPAIVEQWKVAAKESRSHFYKEDRIKKVESIIDGVFR